jgi:hypothetical protein
MTSINDQLQLIGLLDRIARSYPGGIPIASIRKPQAIQAAQPLSCVLISLGSLSVASESTAKLAQAICEKGLRLALESCSIRNFSDETIGDEDLGFIIRETGAAVLIVCGKQGGNRGVKEFNGALVLRSYALADVAASAEIKRRFWEDLKLVMPRLEALRSGGQG